jgi:hypothetical protein
MTAERSGRVREEGEPAVAAVLEHTARLALRAGERSLLLGRRCVAIGLDAQTRQAAELGRLLERLADCRSPADALDAWWSYGLALIEGFQADCGGLLADGVPPAERDPDGAEPVPEQPRPRRRAAA